MPVLSSGFTYQHICENNHKEETQMANRIILNETSYHGKGAIEHIPTEAVKRGFKKALICNRR